MLFDLQGKRRRLVQATYLMLAVLMGGGLVLFGIGSGASGGVFDIFSGDGGGSGNEIVEERIDRNEERVKAKPQAVNAHKELVRDYYALAVGQSDDQGTFPADAQDELRKASSHWSAYLEAEQGEPDTSLARVALQIYDVTALNQPQEAVRVARIIAEDNNDASAYLQLAQYSILAGDKRTENLAADKAIDLAPKDQRKAVREQLTQMRAAVAAAEAQQAQQGGGNQPAQQNQGGQ